MKRVGVAFRELKELKEKKVKWSKGALIQLWWVGLNRRAVCACIV